jgi:hypothetical protein
MAKSRKLLGFADATQTALTVPQIVGASADMLVGSLANANTTDTTSKCTPSAYCDPTYAVKQMNAVINVFAIIRQTTIQVVTCTGATVNSVSGGQFLVTSTSCAAPAGGPGTPGGAADFGDWLLVFNYVAPCGSNMPPAIQNVIQGTVLLFFDQTSGIMLLNIPGAIPAQFNTYLAGMDGRPGLAPASAVGIHHNDGGISRISYANGTVAGSGVSTTFNASNDPNANFRITPAGYYKVNWAAGATSAGAAGSPLFDAATGRLIAVMDRSVSACDGSVCQTQGVNCTTPTGYAYYGRVSSAWGSGLQAILQASSSMPTAPVVTQTVGINSISTDGSVSADSISAPAPAPGAALSGYTGSTYTNMTIDGTQLQNYTGSISFPVVIVLGANTSTESTEEGLASNGEASEEVLVGINNVLTPGEVIQATLTLQSILGELQNISDIISLSRNTLYFSATNYTYSNQTIVVTRNTKVPISGGLLRFNLLVTLTSNIFSNYTDLNLIKGIIVDSPQNITSLAPIMIPSLPYTAKAGVVSPSGRAVFRYRPTANVGVALEVCLMTGYLAEAQVTIYENRQLLFDVGRPPVGSPTPDCVEVANLNWIAGKEYLIVVADQEDPDVALRTSVLASLELTLASAGTR